MNSLYCPPQQLGFAARPVSPLLRYSHRADVALRFENREIQPRVRISFPLDGDNTLAILVRRKGETLAQLLIRLNLANAKAYNEGIFTDEINPPPTNFQHP